MLVFLEAPQCNLVLYKRRDKDIFVCGCQIWRHAFCKLHGYIWKTIPRIRWCACSRDDMAWPVSPHRSMSSFHPCFVDDLMMSWWCHPTTWHPLAVPHVTSSVCHISNFVTSHVHVLWSSMWHPCSLTWPTWHLPPQSKSRVPLVPILRAN